MKSLEAVAKIGELLDQIRRVFKEHKGRYGSPRITRALRQGGLRCGKNRVARLMRDHELAAQPKKGMPATEYPGRQEKP